MQATNEARGDSGGLASTAVQALGLAMRVQPGLQPTSRAFHEKKHVRGEKVAEGSSPGRFGQQPVEEM